MSSFSSATTIFILVFSDVVRLVLFRSSPSSAVSFLAVDCCASRSLDACFRSVAPFSYSLLRAFVSSINSFVFWTSSLCTIRLSLLMIQ